MKIYTKIRIDLKTGKTIEEESFEHSGPVAVCMGADSDDPFGYDDPARGGFNPSGPGYGGGDIGDPDPFGMGLSSGVSVGSISDIADAIAKTSSAATKSTWDNIKNAVAGFFSGLATPIPGGAVVGAIVGYNINAIKSYINDIPRAIAETANKISVDYDVTPEVAEALATKITNENKKAIDSGHDGELMGGIMAGTQPELAAAIEKNYGVPMATVMANLTAKGLPYDLVSQITSEMAGPKFQGAQSTLNTIAHNPELAKYGLYGNEAAFKAAISAPIAPTAGDETPAPTPGAWGGGTTDQLGNLMTVSAPDMTAYNAAMDEFKKINTDIKFVHDMSELEGVTLSDEEKQFLETMRLNATTNLTNTVNESTLDLAETEIARMVSKGVLQGNIGSETMAKIYEKAGKIVGEQSRNIESDVAKMGLGVLEQKKLNQMNLWGKELEADIAGANVGVDKWKSVGLLELGKAEQGLKWNQSLVDALTTMRGQDIGLEGQKLGASTNLSLASQEMKTWKDVNEQANWANIGGALIKAWAD